MKKYLHNIFWIMGDKMAGLGVGFLVTAIVARYLGPEEFGVYSYAISTTALFAAAGHMGLSGLVIREIVKNPAGRGVTLGTTLGLKFIGMVAGYLALLIYALVYEGLGSVGFTMLLVAGAVLLFKPFDVIDFWFQSFVQARHVTVARLVGLAFVSILKLLFVLLGLGVIYFVIANLIQALIVALVLILIYTSKSNLKFSEWSFSCSRAKELFSQGWVIYLGSIFSVIYLKADQVMLRWLVGTEAVGVYAVAAQISEAWYFVPSAITASLFPRLIKLKEENPKQFNSRLQQLFDLLFILAVGVAVIVTLFSEWLVALFFGPHYFESASILVVHIWAAVFIFMRAVFSRWILIENVLVFSLITQGAGAAMNVILNYFFIPKFGAQGAAYATLISYAFSSFFLLFLYSKTRPIFFMMVKSMLFLNKAKYLIRG